MADVIFNKGKADILNGSINMEVTATTSVERLQVVLLSTSYAPNATETNCANWVASEVGHANYKSAANRKCLESKYIGTHIAAGTVALTATSTVYTTSVNGEAFRWVGIAKYASQDSLALPIVCLDVTSQSCSGGAITIAWHANGILNFV